MLSHGAVVHQWVIAEPSNSHFDLLKWVIVKYHYCSWVFYCNIFFITSWNSITLWNCRHVGCFRPEKWLSLLTQMSNSYISLSITHTAFLGDAMNIQLLSYFILCYHMVNFCFLFLIHTQSNLQRLLVASSWTEVHIYIVFCLLV